MRRHRRLLHMVGLLLAAFAATALVACGSSDDSGSTTSKATTSGGGASADVTPVKAGIVEYSGIAPTQLGIDKGIFKKHGIDLTLVPADTPAAITAQVLSGQLDLGFGTSTTLMTAASKGAPLQAVSAVDGLINPKDAVSAIMVAPDSGITSPKDLNGKQVAVVALGSELDVLMKAVVDQDGGDSKTVQAVQIPFPQMLPALKAGRVDAIVTTEPFMSLAEKAGMKTIAEPEVQILPDGSVTSYAASKKYASENPDVIKGFQAAMQESLGYAKAHPDEALAAVATVTGLSPDEVKTSHLGTVYAPKLDRGSFQKMQDLMTKYGVIEKPLDLNTFILPGA